MSVSQVQFEQISNILSRDRADNYYQLQIYLRTILANRQVDFVIDDNNTVSLDPREAWSAISRWGQTEEANLPIGETGSVKTLAGRLLGYIETNIVGRSQEAASAYQSIIEQARKPITPSPSPSPELDHFQKANAKRRELFDAINAKFLGQLTTELEKSRYLQRIKDPYTRSLVASFLSANAANLREFTTDKRTGATDLPERINTILLTRAGYKDVNNAIHQAYSQPVQDGKELEQVVEIVNHQIAASYKSDQEFIQDQDTLRTLSSLTPTLNDLPMLINYLAPNASAQERSIMARSLQKEIVLAAKGGHQNAHDLLSRAFYQAKLKQGDPSSFSALFPIIEEIESSTRHDLFGSNLRDRDILTLSTYNLAARAGVNPLIPWLRGRDIDNVQQELLGSYKDQNGKRRFATPTQALDWEWSQTNPDLQKIAELSALISQRRQYDFYGERILDNPLLAIQDFYSKTRGRFYSAQRSIDNVRLKTWSTIDKVNNVISWPNRVLLNGWEKLIERTSIPIGKNGFRFALLDPAGSLYKGWVNLQLGWATRIRDWSFGLSGSGRWYSGFFRQVTDLSSSFIGGNGNWSQANFLFVEKKWGNFLNWSAQRFFQSENWAQFAGKITQQIATAANKIAPGLGEKIVAAIGAGTSESGIGLIILGLQVLWEMGKAGLSRIKNFVSSLWSGHPDKTLLGSAFLVVNGLLAGIPIMLITAWETLKAVAKVLWDTLLSIFALAIMISIGAVMIAVLLFNAFKTTTNLDSGVAQMVSNVVCNLTGSTPAPNASPLESAGKCIYDFLQQNGINPLTASNATGSAWNAFAKALGNAAAASIIQISATGQGVFQCVGYIAGAGAMIGKPFNPTNACNYVNHAPSGYSWTTKPTKGCFFVIGSSTCSQCGQKNAPANSCGHVGIVTAVNGGIINAMDANGTTPWGMVRANAQFPTSSIAGYMCP